MIARDAQPIAHHPPLKPINLRPVYPPAEDTRSFWEMQYDESIRAERAARHERMWEAVVEFAQGRGTIPARRPFAGPTEAAGEPDVNLATSGSQDADSAPVAVSDDDRNSTGYAPDGLPWEWRPDFHDLRASIERQWDDVF